MSSSFAAIVGGAAGSLVLLAAGIGFIWLYLCKGLSNKTSETGSSDPSTLVEWNRASRISSSGCAPDHQQTRLFSLEELEQATQKFNESNIVGVGSFGVVYKGLLLDGTIVAIKRRQRASRPEFIEEEGGHQMLVFEYLPNRSICSHLYDTGKNQTAKLEFKQRLSIAIGAAKGLAHLHGLSPPLVHNNFKTSNVLVDEDFIAKVADAGIVRLLQRIDDASTSQASVSNIFQDQQFGQFGVLYETSDTYSFGVFLLELITGREAAQLMFQVPSESLTKLVEALLRSDSLIDVRLGNTYTYEGMKEFIVLALRCLSPPGRRPKMEHIVRELDRILETEMTLTTVMGDGTPIVTLGSQLFT